MNMDYLTEAKGDSLVGKIICGSRCGYKSQRDISLEVTLEIIDSINIEIENSGLQPIPCIVTEGILIGRASNEKYREKVYNIGFSWSPRSPAMEKSLFYNTLLQYAKRLGKEMEQERVYLEFDGKTEVLKKVD